MKKSVKFYVMSLIFIHAIWINNVLSQSTWVGTTTDWFTASNWSPSGVPLTTTNVIIPDVANEPVINTTGAVCNNITISPSSTLTVNSSSSLNIYGILLNNGTITNNGNLVLVSNITKTALLSGNSTGNILGNITVQRHIPGNSTYSYISSPISSASKSVVGAPSKFLYYTNPSGWNNATSATLDVGKGYAAYYTNSPTINFTGTANNGNINVTVNTGTYIQNSISYTNYNLVGNPYPSPISISEFLNDNTGNLESNSVWLWDRTDYATSNLLGIFVNSPSGRLSGLDYISSGQGFFVKVNSVPNISFNNGMRTTTNEVFAKSIKGSDTIQRLFLNISNKGGLFNETLIAFKKDATYGIDANYDSPKIIGNPDIALYSLIGIQPFVIQTLPLLKGKDSVRIGVVVANAGEYTLRLSSLLDFDLGTNILLEDKELNQFQDIREDSSYTFTFSKSGTFNERFMLHFLPKSTSILDIKNEEESCKIFVNNRNLLVNYQSMESNNAIMSVYNLNGQRIINNAIIDKGLNSYQLSASPGLYIVKVVTNHNIYTKKAYIY